MPWSAGVQIAVFRGLMKHSIVNSVHEYVSDVFGVWSQHRLMINAIGTRLNDGSRRQNGECRKTLISIQIQEA